MTFESEVRQHEDDINKSDGEGLHARWASGQVPANTELEPRRRPSPAIMSLRRVAAARSSSGGVDTAGPTRREYRAIQSTTVTVHICRSRMCVDGTDSMLR